MIIESKNSLIESKVKKIKELTTKLIYREEFLNSIGIQGRCECNYCSKAILELLRFKDGSHFKIGF